MRFPLFVTVLALLAGSTAQALAAKPKLPPRYDQWLNQKVVYIITDEERKAFQQLQTDRERDQFIQDFWDVRNPQRGSGHNPYKQEIEQRIEYANAHFGRMTNTPGWMTDMGRAYIVLGKPISTHAFVGYGQIYPLELWSYANNTGDPSLPPFFNLLFFQPEGIEEYRFYRPFMDGPMKLVRGSNFNSNGDVYRFLMPLGGDVARAAFTLMPSGPIDTQTFQPDLASDMLVSKIQNLQNDTFNVRRIRAMRALRGEVRSYLLLTQDRPLQMDSFALPDPAGQYWLDYVVAIDREEMGVPAKNGTDLDLRIDYHLKTPDGALIMEDSEQRAYPAFDIGPQGKTFQPFELANRLPILPGKYRLEVEVVNRQAGRIYKGTRAISVAAAGDPALRGPLLAGSVAKLERPDGITPFEYYGVAFHPSAKRVFLSREPLTILYELEQPPASQASYHVDYVLANVSDRNARRTLSDTVAPEQFHDGRLLKSKTMPLAGLDSGQYDLVLTVRRSAGGPVLASANLPIKIENDQPAAPLYLSANSRNMGRPGVGPYLRALEASAQKDDADAIRYLQQAVKDNPGNRYAGQFLVQLYFRRRNFGSIADLYHQFGMVPFKGSSETLAQISVSVWQSGQKAEARKLLAEARSDFPDDPALKNLAHALQKAP
jgi:GWxTD domain-containing protein